MADTLTIDSSAPASAVEETRPMRGPARPDAGGFVWGTGRRKAAVARVRVKPGSGKFIVNNKDANVYFTEERDRNDITSPLKVTKTDGKMDIMVNVQGGGYMGQAGAVKLGVARALMAYDPTLESTLRDADMVTRDPRKVERKKPGQPGARKRFQFSKR